MVETEITEMAITKTDTTLPISISKDTNTISVSHEDLQISIINNVSPYIITTDSLSSTPNLILGAISITGLTPRLDIPLGTLNVSRFLALGRTSLWWMTPAWGTISSDIPAETQFLLAELTPAQHPDLKSTAYIVMLPLIDSSSGGKFRATLHSSKHHHRSTSTPPQVHLCIESGSPSTASAIFASSLLIVAGTEPFELLSRGVALAASLSGTAQPRTAKEMPAIADVFGWCTWDAFYSTVSAAGIMEGLGSLVKGGAPPGFLIIDDGWQQTDVDAEYRLPEAKHGVSTSIHEGETLEGIAARADHAVHETEEALADLLASPGDPVAEQLKGEHLIAQEEELHRAQQVDGSQESKKLSVLVQSTDTAPTAPSLSVFSFIKNLASYFLSKLESAIMHFGKAILDGSAADSFIVRAFQALAAGPLKPALLRFYAATTDHCRRLTSIRANAKFATPSTGPGSNLNAPGGDLAAVVSAIKKRFGVRYVYAWHAMGAFWGGLGIQDPGVKKYQPALLQPVPTPGILSTDPSAAWIQPVLCGLSLPLDPSSLHHDMHEYLSFCGIDGVKVDVQSTIGLAGSGTAAGGPSLASVYQSSLENSAAKHFQGNHLINCMCHSTENLYNMTHTNLARVSDDFYPQRPASHTAHIANCAYNSLFMGEIVGADWDMFHSKHPAAFLHAAARAISGGPVYVSDKPGHHDFSLLERLVLPDGRVLRCKLPARPTMDCLFSDVMHDGNTALKLWNANEHAGVIGVFNLQGSSYSRQRRAFYSHDDAPGALTCVVRPSDVAGMDWSLYDRVVMYSDAKKDFTVVSLGNSSIPASPVEDHSSAIPESDKEASHIMVEVGPRGGCDIITISPVQVSVDGSLSFAAIGLVNMINAGGAIESCSLCGSYADGDAAVAVRVKGCGEFLAYSSVRPVSVSIDGRCIEEFEYGEKTGALQWSILGEGAEWKECAIAYDKGA